jgi:hypothetical protein
MLSFHLFAVNFRMVCASLLVVGLLWATPSWAGICLQRAQEAEKAFGIPELMLQSIVMQESGDNPWALNVDGQGLYPKSETEARRTLGVHLQQAKNVDIGCGQISMKYHAAYFSQHPSMALDPWINMVYASKILLDNYQAYGSWTKAVAHYHSADEQRQQAYLCHVMRRMARLKGSPYTCEPPR